MLTRFEKARIVGSRALQISMGAPVLTKVPRDLKEPVAIVLMELKEGVIPLTVVREFPNGEKVFINIKGETFGKTAN